MMRVQFIVAATFLSTALGCSSTPRTADTTTEAQQGTSSTVSAKPGHPIGATVGEARSAAHRLQTIRERILPPPGFERVAAEPGSFGEWLRTLPLKPEGSPVLLWDGDKKLNQTAHYAVIALDVGRRDLQQCADAIIRLRAEYLWAAGRYSDIHYNFTSGDQADYEMWREGYRPRVSGDGVTWVKCARPDRSYDGFREYLDAVFLYAGTASLSAELTPVLKIDRMVIGDVFIRGGFPGHAVIVVDMAQSNDGQRRLFLLAQSYMPAQDIHVLRNPTDSRLSPWYELEFGDELVTPEYTFRRSELKRFEGD